jgi:hypothetical protein
MAKLTDKQWLQVKAKYECGKGVTELSNMYETPKSTIFSKIKKEGWQQGEIAHFVQENANSLNTIANNSRTIAQNRTEIELQTIKEETLNIAGLKNKAQEIQNCMLDIIQFSAEQTKNILKNSPDGLYVSAESAQGTQYKRTTEFVKDLIPAMSAANTILGLDKSNVEITNNTQNNIIKKISNDPVQASRDYQDLIHGK